MATVTDLAESLAGWLGLPRETVDGHVRRLREAGLLPAAKGGRGKVGGAPASAENAVNLLLAVMADVPAVRAPEAVGIYRDLPLLAIHRAMLEPGDTDLRHRVLAKDHPFYDRIPPVFGDALELFILGWSAPDMVGAGFQVTTVQIGGGAGTHRACFALLPAPSFEGPWFQGVVHYGITADGRLPDDAPCGRLDRFSQAPGYVLHLLNRLLGGQPADLRPLRRPEITIGAP
jgi:hypothetical protein